MGTIYQKMTIKYLNLIDSNKLSLEESRRVLGEPITGKNRTTLQFVMEETIQLAHDVKQLISQTPSEQPATLEARIYPTKITDEYIDISIINE